MELQSQLIPFQRFFDPPYRYQPQQEKKTQNKYLEMYFKSNPDIAFVKLVESIFSDRYLYQNKSFRLKVQSNKKGYVNIQDVLNNKLIINFLQEIENQQKPNKKDILKLIQKYSTKLLCNRNQVRRKNLFINNIKYARPLYIEEFPENDGNQELEELLLSTTTIYKIKYRHMENWAIIYAQDPDKIFKLNNHQWSINTYLKVMSYQQSKREFDSPHLSEVAELIRIQQKSFFKQIIQDKKEVDYSKFINSQKYLRQARQQNIDQLNNDTIKEYIEQQSRQFNENNSDIDQHLYVLWLNQNSDKNKLNKSIRKLKCDAIPNFQFNNQHLLRYFQSNLSHSQSFPALKKQNQEEIDSILMKFFDNNIFTFDFQGLIRNKNNNLPTNKMQTE